MEENRPRRWTSAMRMVLITGIAVIFGIATAWIKGNGAGLRDAIGNISAVWLLLPFAAGAATGSRRVIVGAISGWVATLAALIGFYFAESFVLDLGQHSWLTD